MLFWFLVIAVIPAELTGLFGYRISQNMLKKYVSKQLSITAEVSRGQIDKFLELKKGMIVAFSSDGLIKDKTERIGYYGKVDERMYDLSNHLAKNKAPLDPDILETFVMDLEGEVIASSIPQHIRLKRPNADYFIQAKRHGVYATDLHRCIDAEEPVIEVSRLLTNRKSDSFKVIGVMVNRIKGDSIVNLFTKGRANSGILAQGRDVNIFILNGNNQIVAGSNIPKNATLKKTINTEPVIRFNDSGQEIIDIYQDHLGNQVFGVSMYIDEMDWLIMAEEDVKKAFFDIKYIRHVNIITRIVTICIVVFLAIYVSRGLTSPIKNLLEGTKKLAKGMLSYRIRTKSRDEIGELAGSFNTMAGSIQERTDTLAQTRDYLENILKNTRDMIMTTNAKTNIVEFNAGAEMILGYKKEEVIGKSAEMFYLHKAERNKLLEMIKKEGAVQNYETKIKTKEGKIIDIIITISQLRDNSGNFIGTVGVSKDITERKQIEEMLLQSEKLMAMGVMTSGITHEFNNIFAIIHGFAYLIGKRYGDHTKLQKGINAIHRATDDGVKIVRRMQNFTDIEMDTSRFIPVDMGNLTKQAVEFSRPRWKNMAHAKGITYRIDMKGVKEVPAVMGNHSELREVLLNVINNALDAMPDGGTLSFCTWTKNSTVYVSISDTGEGMSEEVQKKIFDPFFTTKRPEGTGLGMSATYGIIKNHDGNIEVESEVGKGSAITISLPSTTKAYLPKTHLPIEPPQSIQKIKAKNLRILVVDDEQDFCELLDDFFTEEGHNVKSVNSGAKAIELLKTEDFNLVLCDLAMPEVSGYDVIEAVNRLEKKPKVGLITGWRDKIGTEKNRVLKVDFIVKKPFKFSKLTKVINNVLSTE